MPACPAFRQLPDQPWWGFYSVTSSAFPRPLNGCAGISFRATCPESFLSQRSHTRNKDCSGQHWLFFIIIIISRLWGRSLFCFGFFSILLSHTWCSGFLPAGLIRDQQRGLGRREKNLLNSQWQLVSNQRNLVQPAVPCVLKHAKEFCCGRVGPYRISLRKKKSISRLLAAPVKLSLMCCSPCGSL